MPAGVSPAPGRIPHQSLIFKLALGKPEHKIMRIALVFINFDTCAGFEVFEFNRSEFSVCREGRNIVIEVAACRIRMPVCFDPLDQFYHIGYMVGSFTYDIRAADIEPFGIFKECLSIEIGNFQHTPAAFLRRLNHLIFTVIGITRKMAYIGYIHYVRYRIP